jgi:hypothetical protein
MRTELLHIQRENVRKMSEFQEHPDQLTLHAAPPLAQIPDLPPLRCCVASPWSCTSTVCSWLHSCPGSCPLCQQESHCLQFGSAAACGLLLSGKYLEPD